jgi:hypothetical protein
MIHYALDLSLMLFAAAIALTGQVAGRIESVEPVESILHGTVRGFRECLLGLEKFT